MVCNSYLELSDTEQKIFIGELVHTVMHSDEAFKDARKWLTKHRAKGVLDGVKFYPERDVTEDISPEATI